MQIAPATSTGITAKRKNYLESQFDEETKTKGENDTATPTKNPDLKRGPSICVPQKIIRKNNRIEKDQGSSILHVFYNSKGDQLYVVTEDEVAVYEYPSLNQIVTRKGDFKKVTVLQLSANQDLILWIDDETLYISKIDNFFDQENIWDQSGYYYKSEIPVSSASFLWDDSVLFSTIEKGIVEIKLLRVKTKDDKEEKKEEEKEKEEIKQEIRQEIKEVIKIQIEAENAKKLPEYYEIDPNSIRLSCKFAQVKIPQFQESPLSKYIQTSLHAHPLRQQSRPLVTCSGKNNFKKCLTREETGNNLIAYECEKCKFTLCQSCIAQTAQYVIPAIINSESQDHALALINDFYTNAIKIVEMTKFRKKAFIYYELKTVSQFEAKNCYSYYFDLDRISFFLPNLPNEAMIVTYMISKNGNEYKKIISDIKLKANDNYQIKGFYKNLVVLYSQTKKTLEIHDQDNFGQNSTILDYKKYNEERKFVLNKKNYVTIFHKNILTTDSMPLKQVYRQLTTSYGGVFENKEKLKERVALRNLSVSDSKIIDLNLGTKYELGCQPQYYLKKVYDFPEIKEFYVLFGNNKDKKLQIAIKQKSNLTLPCQTFDHTFEKDDRKYVIRYFKQHEQGYEFYILEKHNTNSQFYKITIKQNKLTQKYELSIDKDKQTLPGGYFDFKLTPNRQQGIFVNSTKIFDRIEIKQPQKPYNLLQKNQRIYNDHFEIINNSSLIYKSDKYTLKKINFLKALPEGEIKPFALDSFNFFVINEEFIVLSNWNETKYQIILCSTQNLFGNDAENPYIIIQTEEFQRTKIRVTSKNNNCYYGVDEYQQLLPTCCNIEYEDPKIIFYDLDKNPLTFINAKFFNSQYDRLEELYSKTDQEIIKIFSSGLPDYVLVHLHSQVGSFLHKMSIRPLVIKEFVRQLHLIDKKLIPHLFFKNKDGNTPLKIAVSKNQVKSIDLMMEMLCKFFNNPYFNFAVDECFCDLIEKDINLQGYFQSKLPMFYIEREEFVSLHSDNRTVMKGVKYDSIEKIFTNYEELFGKKFKAKEEDKNDSKQYTIEYLVVNMPETLNKEPRKLIQHLNNIQKLDIFENPTIQTIITFKWKMYTRQYFQRQFYAFTVMTLIYLVDVYYTFYLRNNDFTVENNGITDYYIYTNLILKLACISILMCFAVYEFQCAIKNWGIYIQDLWNIVDFCLVPLYAIITVLFFNDVRLDVIQLFYCLLSIAVCLKICFLLRVYDGFSFLVSMMLGVFRDLKYFLAFYLIVLVFFTVLFYVLTINYEEEYGNIDAVAYFFMSFRTSVGDFAVDQFQYQQYNLLKVITWIVWVSAVLILNIVFMNFIIAVISESYEKIMQQLISQTYKVKIGMIMERELHLSEDDFKNQDYFPRYIVLRRQANNQNNDVQQWEGFIKDLKSSISTQLRKLNKSQQRGEGKLNFLIQETKTLIHEESFQTNAQVDLIKGDVNKLNQKFDSIQEKLILMIDKLNKLEEKPKVDAENPKLQLEKDKNGSGFVVNKPQDRMQKAQSIVEKQDNLIGKMDLFEKPQPLFQKSKAPEFAQPLDLIQKSKVEVDKPNDLIEKVKPVAEKLKEEVKAVKENLFDKLDFDNVKPKGQVKRSRSGDKQSNDLFDKPKVDDENSKRVISKPRNKKGSQVKIEDSSFKDIDGMFP